MRLSASFLLLAGLGLAQYAAASPIRVVLVSSSSEVSTNVSFGDARPIQVVGNDGAAVAPVMHHGAGRHAPCSKLKDKAVAWSNKFREAFGLPLIQPHVNVEALPFVSPPPARIPMHQVKTIEPELRILPFIGTPPVMEAVRPAPVADDRGPHRVHILPIPDSKMAHRMGNRQRHASFLHRAHHALMMLGPWEGRAVAFVLGCGIGVLLRMLWVMTVVVARTIRGGRNTEEEDVHDVLVFEADAEHILVPPPQYSDEKVALAAPSEAEREVKA